MDWKSILLNLWGIFWMLFFFGGSIFIHEFGHFIIAKKRGLRVPKFSIGFGPKIFSWKRGETEYCIALLPLGGYVALPQMGEIPILEGNTKDTSKPLTFTDKFLVAIMGALFNLLLAFVLACILWGVGLKVPTQDSCTEIGYILPEYNGVPTPAMQAGLQKGDKIIAVDNTSINTFSDIEKNIILGNGRDKDGHPQVKITYQRHEQISHTYLKLVMMRTNPLTGDEIRFSGILSPKQTLIVEGFEKESSAEKCGIKKGDILLKVDQIPLFSFVDLREYLNTQKPSHVELSIKRNDEFLQIPCDIKSEPHTRAWLHYGENDTYLDFYQLNDNVHILEVKGQLLSAIPQNGTLLSCNGIHLQNLEHLEQILKSCESRTIMLEIQTQQHKRLMVIPNLKPDNLVFHPAETIQRLGLFFSQPMQLIHDNPWVQFKQAISSTFGTLSSLINKNSDVKMQHLMGAPGIMRLLHRFSTDDFRRLLWFIVLLNINLAILNLLPIPVLDGGHILFAVLEKIFRKPLPAKFIIVTQNLFVLLFLGLMAYVIFFDIRRWQGDLETEASQQRFEKLMEPLPMH